jgi:hypothetical protein
MSTLSLAPILSIRSRRNASRIDRSLQIIANPPDPQPVTESPPPSDQARASARVLLVPAGISLVPCRRRTSTGPRTRLCHRRTALGSPRQGRSLRPQDKDAGGRKASCPDGPAGGLPVGTPPAGSGESWRDYRRIHGRCSARTDPPLARDRIRMLKPFSGRVWTGPDRNLSFQKWTGMPARSRIGQRTVLLLNRCSASAPKRRPQNRGPAITPIAGPRLNGHQRIDASPS